MGAERDAEGQRAPVAAVGGPALGRSTALIAAAIGVFAMLAFASAAFAQSPPQAEAPRSAASPASRAEAADRSRGRNEAEGEGLCRGSCQGEGAR